MIESRISEVLGRRRENIMDMARGAGLSYGAAHALYHGTSKSISLDVLDRLCRYFNCQPGDLFVHVPSAERSVK